MNLSSRSEVIGLLKKHGLFLKKSLGQNFLVDPDALSRILAAVDPQPDDAVLEIGPGIGTLTHALAERAGELAAVEYDPRFFAILQESFASSDHVRLIHGDVLKIDLREVLAGFERPVKVAANLPYYITTPTLSRLLDHHDLLKRIVVLVQKEVADRIQAKPGTSDYGSLSVYAQFYTQPEIVGIVSAGSFLPPPKIASAIVRMEVRETPPVEVPSEAFFFTVVRAAFGQRRKTLLNALAGGTHYPKEAILAATQSAGLSPQIRGETLGLEEFGALSRALWERVRPTLDGL